MAAAPKPLLMTVEQYYELPVCDSMIHELRWGQLVHLTFPKMKHIKVQSRLVRLLRPKAEHLGVVEVEVPFRALAEYDLRGADVAFITRERWEAVDENDNLHGSPELVIEVLSPSNSKREIQEKATLCLATGAQEFWIVNTNRKTVTVIQRNARIRYEVGQNIPLALFGGELSVADIFG